MKSVIRHRDGRRINLAGGVDPETYAELEHLHCSRTNPVLWCDGCGDSIYIRHGSLRKDELFGAHHRRGDCAETLVIRKAQMSDEHKRQAEYHALAAERAGHSADFEVTTSGHTRVDVVIDGAVGFEIQRSILTKAAAVDRTARSIAGGLRTVAWFTDRTTSPLWNGHVPGYRTTDLNWRQLPPLGTAMAAGLQMIEAVPCGTRTPCSHPRPCNRFVPIMGAWTGLRIDDVVEGLAADEIRPARLGKYVRMLSIASIKLYEELAGARLTYDVSRPKGQVLQPAERQDCERPPVMYPYGAPEPLVQMTVDAFLQNSALCKRPGCRSGPGGRPGRTMDPSGLCYVCRGGRR